MAQGLFRGAQTGPAPAWRAAIKIGLALGLTTKAALAADVAPPALFSRIEPASLDTHGRNARWFMLARAADQEEMGRRFRVQRSRLAGAEEPAGLKCPMTARATDGCLDAPAGTFSLAPCFGPGGHFLQGGQSWDRKLGAHPPPWNVPACDYKIGSTVGKAAMLAVSAADFADGKRVRYDPWLNPPAGCAPQPFPASPWPWSDASGAYPPLPYLICGDGPIKQIAFRDYYMGAQNGHEAVAVYVRKGVTALTFENVIFDSDRATTAGIRTRHLGVYVGQVYTEGGSSEDIVLRNVSLFGNFNDGTDCCDAGWGIVLFWNTTGTLRIDYSAFYHVQQYMMNFSVSANRADTVEKGSLEFLHSLVDGCAYRSAIGHAECFTGAYAFKSIHIAYNVLRWPPQGGGHQSFFHINSSANPSAPDLGNGRVEIDHNLELSNSIVPVASRISPRVGTARNLRIKYHLDRGVFTLDDHPRYSDGASAVEVLAPTVQLKKGFFNLWKRLGANAYGPTFSIDCPGNQPSTVYCPTSAKSPSGADYEAATDYPDVTTDTIYNLTGNYFHDWYYVPTVDFSAHDNFVDLDGIGIGWMAAPKYCGVSPDAPRPAILTGNVNLQTGDGAGVSSLSIRPGTGKGC